MSRNEDIMQSIVDGTPYNQEPQSRNEALLLQIKEKIENMSPMGGSSKTVFTQTPTIKTESEVVE